MQNNGKNFARLCGSIAILYSLLGNSTIQFKIATLITGIIILFLSFYKSSLFDCPAYLWGRLGLVLQKITSPIILGGLFVFIFIPIGFLKKRFNKNYFDINYESEKKSYWKDIQQKKDINFRNQF